MFEPEDQTSASTMRTVPNPHFPVLSAHFEVLVEAIAEEHNS
jgi:hypothetical protein